MSHVIVESKTNVHLKEETASNKNNIQSIDQHKKMKSKLLMNKRTLKFFFIPIYFVKIFSGKLQLKQ